MVFPDTRGVPAARENACSASARTEANSGPRGSVWVCEGQRPGASRPWSLSSTSAARILLISVVMPSLRHYREHEHGSAEHGAGGGLAERFSRPVPTSLIFALPAPVTGRQARALSRSP